MPPLPVSFDEPTLAALESAQRRQSDLADFQIPRLRKCAGPLALQQRLAGELREDLDALARQVEVLEVSVDDQRGELNRRELGKIVAGLQQSVATLRKDMRAALLTSKRAIDAQSASNRDELLQSSAFREKQNGDNSGDDALMRANNDVTEALRRTMDLMQGELEKSVLSTQLLDESSATLRSASAQHDTLSFVMSTSKQLITALEKSDWLDRMLLIAGLAVFSLTVAFILKQRIVDRGLRIAFFWTRFIPGFSKSKTVLHKAGNVAVEKAERGEGTLSSVVSTLAASTASAVTVVSSALGASSSEVARASVTTIPAVERMSGSLTVTSSVDPLSTTISVVDADPSDSAVHDEL